MVGDDGKRLEGGLREPPRVPREHVVRHLVVVGGVREEPPATGDLAELEAPVRLGVFRRELGQGPCRLARLDARGLRERGGGHGVVRDEQQGLEKPLERAGFGALQISHDVLPRRSCRLVP